MLDRDDTDSRQRRLRLDPNPDLSASERSLPVSIRCSAPHHIHLCSSSRLQTPTRCDETSDHDSLQGTPEAQGAPQGARLHGKRFSVRVSENCPKDKQTPTESLSVVSVSPCGRESTSGWASFEWEHQEEQRSTMKRRAIWGGGLEWRECDYMEDQDEKSGTRRRKRRGFVRMFENELHYWRKEEGMVEQNRGGDLEFKPRERKTRRWEQKGLM